MFNPIQRSSTLNFKKKTLDNKELHIKKSIPPLNLDKEIKN
jgi:hypothetical protein